MKNWVRKSDFSNPWVNSYFINIKWRAIFCSYIVWQLSELIFCLGPEQKPADQCSGEQCTDAWNVTAGTTCTTLSSYIKNAAFTSSNSSKTHNFIDRINITCILLPESRMILFIYPFSKFAEIKIFISVWERIFCAERKICWKFLIFWKSKMVCPSSFSHKFKLGQLEEIFEPIKVISGFYSPFENLCKISWFSRFVSMCYQKILFMLFW